jgi:hypothetical protein
LRSALQGESYKYTLLLAEKYGQKAALAVLKISLNSPMYSKTVCYKFYFKFPISGFGSSTQLNDVTYVGRQEQSIFKRKNKTY